MINNYLNIAHVSFFTDGVYSSHPNNAADDSCISLRIQHSSMMHHDHQRILFNSAMSVNYPRRWCGNQVAKLSLPRSLPETCDLLSTSDPCVYAIENRPHPVDSKHACSDPRTASIDLPPSVKYPLSISIEKQGRSSEVARCASRPCNRGSQ